VQHHAIIAPIRRARASRILKFACVGCIGVAINTVVLYILSRWLGLPLAASSAVAVELAIISNYFINDRWTFAARAVSVRRFAKFNVASLSGLSVNVATVWLLTRIGVYFIAANLLGITLGFASNYALSSVWVWGRGLCR
jgi:putative flippase GtrA